MAYYKTKNAKTFLFPFLSLPGVNACTLFKSSMCMYKNAFVDFEEQELSVLDLSDSQVGINLTIVRIS